VASTVFNGLDGPGRETLKPREGKHNRKKGGVGQFVSWDGWK